MKRASARYVVVLTALLFTATGVYAQETYTVRAGDTLYRIATTYDMSVEELKELNGLSSNDIRIGQELLLYGPAETLAVRDTTLSVGRVRSYTVDEGETLYSIAADLGTAVYVLEALNDVLRGPLEAGRSLTVPVETEGRAVFARGEAAIFPDTYAGRIMAGGEPYDPSSFVVSHRDLPMGTVLLLENREAGRATFARVADRGPLTEDLLIDVSQAVANELELADDSILQAWLVE